MEINDGCNTHFWFDDWLQVGPLIEITGSSGPQVFCVPRSATVAKAASATCWKLRSRIRYFQALYDKIQHATLPSSSLGRDVVLWRQELNVYRNHFSSKKSGIRSAGFGTQSLGAR